MTTTTAANNVGVFSVSTIPVPVTTNTTINTGPRQLLQQTMYNVCAAFPDSSTVTSDLWYRRQNVILNYRKLLQYSPCSQYGPPPILQIKYTI